MKNIIIATRGSALALWQARHIQARLQEMHPGLAVELLVLKTRGDIILDVPLAKVGGKGLFVKEIEDALLSGAADLAVHSMKDVPMVLPQGLVLGAVPQREDKADLFLSARYSHLDDLPPRAVVGTSSLRRQAQILALRPDLEIRMLRGNVETRLRKMEEGQYDAIILAAAGIKRLGLSATHMQRLEAPAFLPAVGQGALGLELREDRPELMESIQNMDHAPTRICVEAERAFLRGLEGGCQVPIAACTKLEGDVLALEGLVARPDGSQILRETLEAPASKAQSLGEQLAQRLLEQGARSILEDLYTEGHP